MCFLVEALELLNLSSAALSDLLNAHGLSLPKNTTKAAKATKLLSAPEVHQQCSQERREKMEILVKELEQKRKKRKHDEEEEEEDDEEEEEKAGSGKYR